MKTKLEIFDGVSLRVPDNDYFMWPHPTFKGFPSCCGPGEGWGNRLVPESVFRINLSPACWIHDEMFSWRDKTWINFYYANAVFMANCFEINRVKSKSKIRETLRIPFIYIYVKSVNTAIGAKLFFNKELGGD